jgi:hypothetical protein
MKFRIIFLSTLLALQCELFSQVGTFTINGNLSMTSGTSTEIQLESTAGPGIGNDQIVVADAGNDLNVAGSLTISLSGYTVNDADAFQIMSYPDALTGTFSSIAWPVGMEDWKIDYGVKVPGKITIYGPSNAALPVTWLSFDVKAGERGNELTWKTVSELNSDYFVVQHSRNGGSFQDLDKIKAAGNSNIETTYSYVHKSSNSGVDYYRIKQVDTDGSTDYSKLVSVDNTSITKSQISFYPNPSKGIVQFDQPVTQITIMDVIGKVVLRSSGKEVQAIDVATLRNGNYYIEIEGQRAQLLIIQN